MTLLAFSVDLHLVFIKPSPNLHMPLLHWRCGRDSQSAKRALQGWVTAEDEGDGMSGQELEAARVTR